MPETTPFAIENNRLLIEEYNSRFEVDSYLADKGQVPDRFYKAVQEIACVAEEGFSSDWSDRQEPDDIEAQRALVRLCKTALADIEMFINRSAKERAAFYRERLAKIIGESA